MGQLSALCSPAHKAFDSPLEDTHTHTPVLTCTHLHINMYTSQSTPFIHSLLLLALDFSLRFLETPGSSSTFTRACFRAERRSFMHINTNQKNFVVLSVLVTE